MALEAPELDSAHRHPHHRERQFKLYKRKGVQFRCIGCSYTSDVSIVSLEAQATALVHGSAWPYIENGCEYLGVFTYGDGSGHALKIDVYVPPAPNTEVKLYV